MTNKEYIVMLLSDNELIDDGGASFEALVHYHINCPYHCGDKRAHCHNKTLSYERCVACKTEWLDMEVDT